MQSTSASFLSLITIGALIAVAGFFLMGKILAGAAVITEFLLITGGADTIPTVAAVIGRSTGVGKSIFFCFFFHIRFTSPEVTVRFVHSNLLIHF
jgi:hypothetical protein